MLLKLIHIKSFEGYYFKRDIVTFKIFYVACHFTAKCIHFVLQTAVFHCICHIWNYNCLDERR